MLLLRAGLVYCLAVVCLLLTSVLVWHRLELGTTRHDAAVLADRVEELRTQLEAERLKLAAAERRAFVAEDSLERVNAQNQQAKTEAAGMRLKLADELTSAMRARDEARSEAKRLALALENTQSLLRVAEHAAAAAKADAERLAKAQAERVAATAAAQSGAGVAVETSSIEPNGTVNAPPSVETYMVPMGAAKAAAAAGKAATGDNGGAGQNGAATKAAKGEAKKTDGKKADIKSAKQPDAKKSATKMRKPAAPPPQKAENATGYVPF